MQHGLLSGRSTAQDAATALELAGQSFDRLFDPPGRVYPPGVTEQATHAGLRRIAEARRAFKDIPPDTAPNIPAGYTYLGQFVIHDLTRSHFPNKDSQPINRATAALDLDSVYGAGPNFCPHFFHRAAEPKDTPHLFYIGLTGKALHGTAPGGQPLDLPRVGGVSDGLSVDPGTMSKCPLIADARNDENVILSQLHLLFLRVHNHVADHLRVGRSFTSRAAYEGARRFVLRAYRQIVVHDYLEKLLPTVFFDDFKSDRPVLLSTAPKTIPLEFAFGAARVCHAMSRARYAVNAELQPPDRNLIEVLEFSSHRPDAKLPLPADWVIAWGRFFQTDATQIPQPARRLSPLLSPPLIDLGTTLNDTAPHDSLSFRDLWRCYDQGLPTGQTCAERVAQILAGHVPVSVLRDQAMLPPANLSATHFTQPLTDALEEFDWFRTHTPLTYYLAQEAFVFGERGRRFGPLGAYIFASTFRLALPAPGAAGQPAPPFEFAVPRGVATMPDFIKMLDLGGRALADRIDATVPNLT